MESLKPFALYTATATTEIVGCYLPWLWLQQRAGVWVLVPAGLSLALFVWLLTLHPHAAGRVYAAYGGVYVATALAWLWAVDGVRPDRWDLLGGAITLLGAAVIYFGPRASA
jgi:small multidrug resistance family-3 protein